VVPLRELYGAIVTIYGAPYGALDIYAEGRNVVRWILGSSGNLQIVLNTQIKGDSQWSTARGVVFGNEDFR